MEVHFLPEFETTVTHSAARQSRNTDELVQDVVFLQDIEAETRFVEAAKPGEGGLEQSEYLTREQRSNP